MKFLIGSSYFSGGMEHRLEFARIWHWNTIQARPEPSRIVVICEAGGQIPYAAPNMDVIHLTGDLGNFMHLVNKQKPHAHTGWSASMLALAMIAYIDEADLIYKEQDCLAFGPWIERMYSDLGDGDIVFGGKHESPPYQGCSQSLFLVKHAFIPEFIKRYLDYGPEGDMQRLGEHRFMNMENELGRNRVRHLSFGQDREKPVHWEHSPLYFQQPTNEELEEAHRRGFI